MRELFAPNISAYDLHDINSSQSRKVYSFWHGTDYVSYLGPKIWDLGLTEIKECKSLNAF